MHSLQLVNIICIIVYTVLLLRSVRANSDVSSLKLEQHVLHTWTNRSFYGFQGIRYARAPVGELRFQVIS